MEKKYQKDKISNNEQMTIERVKINPKVKLYYSVHTDFVLYKSVIPLFGENFSVSVVLNSREIVTKNNKFWF